MRTSPYGRFPSRRPIVNNCDCPDAETNGKTSIDGGFLRFFGFSNSIPANDADIFNNPRIFNDIANYKEMDDFIIFENAADEYFVLASPVRVGEMQIYINGIKIDCDRSTMPLYFGDGDADNGEYYVYFSRGRFSGEITMKLE